MIVRDRSVLESSLLAHIEQVKVSPTWVDPKDGGRVSWVGQRKKVGLAKDQLAHNWTEGEGMIRGRGGVDERGYRS